MLEVRGLMAGYGALPVLRGIDFAIGAGEIVAVLGSNGAGKTTLNSVLSGLLKPTSGSIRFADAEIAGAAPHRIVALGLIHVPEGRRVFPTLTVRENLELGSFRRGRTHRARTLERVVAIFPRLRERFAQRAGTLSGGEQQMLAIGRGLASAPELLMLDEPSMGLAPAVVDAIFERIRTIHRERGLTILLVEQRVGEALEACDHAYVLETGRVVLHGPRDTMMSHARVKQAYLGM